MKPDKQNQPCGGAAQQPQAPEPAAWVQEMIAYHQRTGAYRPEDLRRLLGDPTKSVTVIPINDHAEFFTERE